MILPLLVIGIVCVSLVIMRKSLYRVYVKTVVRPSLEKGPSICIHDGRQVPCKSPNGIPID